MITSRWTAHCYLLLQNYLRTALSLPLPLSLSSEHRATTTTTTYEDPCATPFSTICQAIFLAYSGYSRKQWKQQDCHIASKGGKNSICTRARISRLSVEFGRWNSAILAGHSHWGKAKDILSRHTASSFLHRNLQLIRFLSLLAWGFRSHLQIEQNTKLLIKSCFCFRSFQLSSLFSSVANTNFILLGTCSVWNRTWLSDVIRTFCAKLSAHLLGCAQKRGISNWNHLGLGLSSPSPLI